jgi:hypothetical protein
MGTGKVITSTGLNSFKIVTIGNFNINTNSSGYSPNITLPTLANGFYIVTLGNNFNDANTLIVLRVSVMGNIISSVMLEIGNAYNTFGVRLGSWGGALGNLTFTITGSNYPSNYTSFTGYYYPVCVF